MNTTLEQLTNLRSIHKACTTKGFNTPKAYTIGSSKYSIRYKEGISVQTISRLFSGRRSKYSIYLHTGVLQVCVLVIIPNQQDILTYLNWTYELSATFVASWSISICLFLRHLEIMLGLSTTADQLWKKNYVFSRFKRINPFFK